MAKDGLKRPFHGAGEIHMGRVAILWAGAVVLMVMVGSSGTAYAITTFARMYKMKCDSCHSEVPKLNEFGAAFMAKGFVLPGQDGGEKQGEGKPSPKGEVSGTSDGRIEGKELGNVGGSGSGAKDMGMAGTVENTAPPPVVEPPPPTVVYKVPTRDGSVYFTDNPDRKGSLVSDQELETGKEEGEVRTSLFPRKKQAVRPPAQERRPVVVKSTKPAREKPERYRTYAECMERQLDGTEQPESAQEMMDLFVTAETKCAPYQAGKR